MAKFSHGAVLVPLYPNKSEIKGIIENLSENPDSFIIAENNDGTQYIQCTKLNGKYILHFSYWEMLHQCRNSGLTSEKVSEIFHEFNTNTDAWQGDLIWEKVELYDNKVTPYAFTHIFDWFSPIKIALIISVGLLVFIGIQYF